MRDDETSLVGPTIRSVDTDSLHVVYEQTGPDAGTPVVLLHGFPYDVRQFDAVRDKVAGPDRRIIVPYVRGFGPTRYRSTDVFRSGQQAALGKDVIDLLDALNIDRAVVGGFDWGGRAACIAAALWPERVSGLFSASAYAIQNIAKTATAPKPAAAVYAHWYQMYFNTPQGRIGLEADRDDISRFLWHLWSPSWAFSDEEFARTAESFQNVDFVATVIQSYRHRFRNAPGDPSLDELEARLAKAPTIAAPTIVLHGMQDGVEPPDSVRGHEQHFSGTYEFALLEGVGHCVPAEAPEAVAEAFELLLKE